MSTYPKFSHIHLVSIIKFDKIKSFFFFLWQTRYYFNPLPHPPSSSLLLSSYSSLSSYPSPVLLLTTSICSILTLPLCLSLISNLYVLLLSPFSPSSSLCPSSHPLFHPSYSYTFPFCSSSSSPHLFLLPSAFLSSFYPVFCSHSFPPSVLSILHLSLFHCSSFALRSILHQSFCHPFLPFAPVHICSLSYSPFVLYPSTHPSFNFSSISPSSSSLSCVHLSLLNPSTPSSSHPYKWKVTLAYPSPSTISGGGRKPFTWLHEQR